MKEEGRAISVGLWKSKFMAENKTENYNKNYNNKTEYRTMGAVKNRWSGKRGLWFLAFAVLLCVQVLVLIYYGDKKAGFHEDEYYSYYSTNRTAGLYQPDREWMERDTFRNEFVVLEGEGFNYGLVALVQSWDVHPPFYYFILHTACSLFPGVFSKWLGIGINIVAYCLNFMLLSWLTYRITGRNKVLAFLVAAVHGFNAVIISGVMFIRMYEWLTVFVLLCACLHVEAVFRKDMSLKKFLLPLMAVNYLGFLTQYYYIIFLFFMAAGFCLWRLWKDRKLWNCIRYGIACGGSLILAVLSYRASFSHIFRGYRGTGAVSEFVNAANTGERLSFFAGLMNEYLFDGYLWLWLAALLVLTCVVWVKSKVRNDGVFCEELEGDAVATEMAAEPVVVVYGLLLFAVLGYFFTISKTALLLYETSNRYQLPVYGIILMLLIAGICGLWKKAVYLFCKKDTRRSKRLVTAGISVVLMLFLAADIHGLASDKVIFLYEEDAQHVVYARENANTPVMILYNDATPYHVWWCSQELMQYEKVYFASQANKEVITDEIICNSDKVIVYAADYDTQDESLQMILDSNPKLAGYELITQKSLWSVYEFK